MEKEQLTMPVSDKPRFEAISMNPFMDFLSALILTEIFVLLKLFKHVSWPWGLVLLPVWSFFLTAVLSVSLEFAKDFLLRKKP